MWFTDNGRDMLGDNYPPCELNKVQKPNQHYGYPYCHGSDISDPEFGDKYPCEDFVKPVQKLGSFFWKSGDIKTIDKFGPDGVSKIIKIISKKTVKFQSGYIYDYAFVMLIALSLLLTFFIFYK